MEIEIKVTNDGRDITIEATHVTINAGFNLDNEDRCALARKFSLAAAALLEDI